MSHFAGMSTQLVGHEEWLLDDWSVPERELRGADLLSNTVTDVPERERRDASGNSGSRSRRRRQT